MINAKTIFTGEEWDDVYLIPPMAFKIWHFHYRCERDDRESFPGEETICRMCGIKDRKTLFANRKWLKEYGWLVQTSKAYKGHNPTFRAERGRLPEGRCELCGCASTRNVCIDCVSRARALKQDIKSMRTENRDTSNAYRSMRTEKRDAKVYCSGSGSASSSPSHCDSNSDSGVLSRQWEEEGKPKPKPTKPLVAGDGTPFPDGFDSLSNADRLFWLDAHRVPGTPAAVDLRQSRRKPVGYGAYSDPDEFEFDAETMAKWKTEMDTKETLNKLSAFHSYSG